MERKELDCPCKRVQCERHGDCHACKEHHHASKRLPLSTCERIKARKEKNLKKVSTNEKGE